MLLPLIIFACAPAAKNRRVTSTNSVLDSISLNTTPEAEGFMSNILAAYPQYFDSITKNPDSFRVQIIYTQIDRGRNQLPKFTDHYYNVDRDQYYYPASTVKLPVAILALQRLNELNIPGLDKYTTMITNKDHESQSAVFNDPTSADGRPSIGHYIKKILLTSDNDAFNRLYEFLGQEYINNSLHAMGYEDIQIVHRLDIFLTEDENRRTNSISFLDDSNRLVYEKKAERSNLVYAQRDTKLGKGFMRRGELVNEPFDFSKKNKLSLPDLHQLLRSVLFPQMVTKKQRFNLTADDYKFLYKYLSMVPRESDFPPYNETEYPDDYVKFLLLNQNIEDSRLKYWT